MFILIYLFIGVVITGAIELMHRYNLNTGRVRATLFDVVGRHRLEHVTAVIFVYYVVKKMFGGLTLEEDNQ